MAKGDHIYVNRFGGVYSHHGIDCGDGSVIHYAPGEWMSIHKVIRSDMEVFAREDEVLVRDYTAFFDTLRNPETLQQKANFLLSRMVNLLQGIDLEQLDLSPEAVIERAESRMGEQAFSLVFHNCEHFATWCKTGIMSSEQVNAIWKMVLNAPDFYRLRSNKLLLQLFEPQWQKRR